MAKTHLEIRFHTDSEGSVFLENTAVDPQDIKNEELLVMTLYLIRILCVLKGESAVNRTLAELLIYIFDNFESFRRTVDDNEAKLVPYQGAKGRKYFISDCRIADHDMKFALHPHGFGLLMHGIGFYGPNSALLLIRHLIGKHAEDVLYLFKLRLLCRGVGNSWLGGRITQFNQNQSALQIFVLMTEAEHDIIVRSAKN